MAKFCTALILGCDMPETINHSGDEGSAPEGGPSLTLEDYPDDDLTTYSTGDRYMIGYPILADLDDMPVLAVEEIGVKYRPEIAQARAKWARFAAWTKERGVELDEAKVYLTPAEL